MPACRGGPSPSQGWSGVDEERVEVDEVLCLSGVAVCAPADPHRLCSTVAGLYCRVLPYTSLLPHLITLGLEKGPACGCGVRFPSLLPATLHSPAGLHVHSVADPGGGLCMSVEVSMEAGAAACACTVCLS